MQRHKRSCTEPRANFTNRRIIGGVEVSAFSLQASHSQRYEEGDKQPSFYVFQNKTENSRVAQLGIKYNYVNPTLDHRASVDIR